MPRSARITSSWYSPLPSAVRWQGCLGGIAAGRALIGIYTAYFKFPFLVFQLDPASFVIGVTVSILSASAGGLFVLRRVFALTPAAAMRAPAPPNYSRTGTRVGQR